MIAAIKRFLPVRVLLVAAVLALLYLLLGFRILPALGERYLPRYVAEQLQRKASVGKIRVNPILFTVEIKDFRLAEQDDTPVIGFKRLFVDFELSSIFRWAWTFATITLDGLDLRVEIRPDGRLNLLDLLDLLRKPDPGEKDGPPPRVLLRHAALGSGTVSLNDRSGQTPAQAVIGPFNLELRDISTLPEHRGPYALSARLPAGGALSWRGEASLRPIFSRGEVSLKGLKLATLWNFLRDEVNLAEPGGNLNFSLNYQFDYADGASRLSMEKIALRLAGLALSEAGNKAPLLALEAVEAADGRFDLATRELVLPSIEIRKGSIAAQADNSGVINWQRLVKAVPAAPANPSIVAAKTAPAAAEQGAAWRIKLDAVRVDDVVLRYEDHSRAVPLVFSAETLAVGFTAELSLRAGTTQATVNDLAIRLSRVTGAEAGAADPLVSFDSIALEGGNLDLGQQALTVRQMKFAGGASRIVRDKNGIPRIVEIFGAADRGKSPGDAQTGSKRASGKDKPWRIALDALDVDGLRLALVDHSFGQVITYDVENLRAGLKNIRNDGKTPVKFEAALRLKQGGVVKAAGEASQDGSRLVARASVERIDLKPLQPIIASRAMLALASGEVSANMKVDYRAAKGRSELRVAGPASIDNFLLNEADSGERLLAWKTLAAGNLNLSLAPDKLTIDEIRIADLGSKVVIFKDRSLNLAKAFAPPGSVGAGAKVQEPAAKPALAATAAKAREPAARPVQAAVADAEPAFPIVVDRIRIEKGVVDFADLSLVLPFGAKVQDLEGVVSGISTDRASRATVKLEGRVDEYGLARAEGSLNTFNPKVFTDISVIFRNVEMPALSPYSATFAGRKIASGKLALDLHYKIENSALAGETKVVLEKFTLGERVEAPSALNLPLDLAIALLTDADGKLDLTVPIRGNVDNPEFSYGHLVWQAIVNVVTRIVTAPFRALGALFGGSSAENLDSIAFDPGRAVLLPPEQEKLKQVAAALGKRPQLKLAVQGGHGLKDRQALQQRSLQLAVADKLGRKPPPGQEPGLVNVGDAKTQRALEQIFVERNPESALAAYVAEVEKARGKPVGRVNPVLALVGRASADAAFYAALLKRLEQSAAVADDALKQLADARAKSVIDSLAGIHAVPAARLEQRSAAAVGGDAPPQAKLILDVARGG